MTDFKHESDSPVTPTPFHLNDYKELKVKAEIKNQSIALETVMKITKWLNVAVFSLVAVYALIELELIICGRIDADDRVIDNAVFISLVGGTVAQIGAIAMLTLRGIFLDASNTNSL